MTRGSSARIAALMRKDAAEFGAVPSLWLGPLAMLVTAVALPLVTVIALPLWMGTDPLDAREIADAARAAAWRPGAALPERALAEAFLLHRFLPLLALVPVVGALTLVTTSIVGEKQARTLEPLLATPVTAAELLAAKVLIAFAMAMAIGAAGFGLLVGGVAAGASAGVAATFFAAEPLLLVGLVGPAASLVTLVLGAIVSTRAKDARSAQQIGVVVVVPFVLVFMSGLTGGDALPPSTLAAVGAALVVLAAGLGVVAVRLFDRERMLTDWN